MASKGVLRRGDEPSCIAPDLGDVGVDRDHVRRDDVRRVMDVDHRRENNVL